MLARTADRAGAAHASDATLDAVRRRDAAQDGRFYYAVSTTGVYCNPSSAARPARAEHVSFHADGGLAGYRWGVARKRALLERERG